MDKLHTVKQLTRSYHSAHTLPTVSASVILIVISCMKEWVKPRGNCISVLDPVCYLFSFNCTGSADLLCVPCSSCPTLIYSSMFAQGTYYQWRVTVGTLCNCSSFRLFKVHIARDFKRK